MMYQSNMRKTRLASLFLAFVLLFGILPVSLMTTASAANGFTLLVDSTVSNSADSRQNNGRYKYLSEAYRWAKPGDTIKLASDITESLVIYTDLTFDFNGHTLTCPYSSSYQDKDSGIYSAANVTIQDSDPDKKGRLVIATDASGNFMTYGLRASSGGLLTVQDCHIIAPQDPANKKNFFGLDAPSSKVTIRGTLQVEGAWSAETWANGSVLFAMNAGGSGGCINVENGASVNAPGGIINGTNKYGWAPVWFVGDSAANAFCRGTVGQVGVKLDKDYTLQANTNIGFLVPENQTNPVTLDLNGFDISTLGQSGYIDGGSTLNIVNSKPAEPSVIRCGGAPNINRYDDSIDTCGDLTISGNISVENRAPESSSAFCIFQADKNTPISVVLKDCSLYSQESVPLYLRKGTVSMENVAVSTPLDTTPGEHKGVMLSSTKVNTMLGVDFTVKETALTIGAVTAADPINIRNVTVNKGAATGANVGISNSNPAKLTITGKDSYYVCNSIYSGAANALDITAGVYSKDPTAYVPGMVGAKDYAILDYDNATENASDYYLVAPWTKVGTDNKVALYYAADATDTTVASNAVDIDAIGDIDHVVTDPAFVTAKHFTLSSNADTDTAIPGLTVAGFSGTTLTVQKTKATIVPGDKAYVWYGGKNAGEIVFETKTEPTYDVGGDVSDSDGAKLEDVEMKLTQGSQLIYGPVKTDANGKYQFTKLRPGIYNLVATTVAGKIVTSIVTIVDSDLRENLTMPKEERNSILEVKGNDTPAVVVGNLDVIADGYIFGSGESKVVINLTVEKVDEGTTGKATAHAAIRTKAEALHQNETAVILFLDAILEEKVDDKAPVDIGDSNTNVLEVVIPFDVTGKRNIEVFRNHKDSVEQFTALPAQPTGSLTDKTYYMDGNANLIHVYAEKYSDYAITYTQSSYKITSSAGAGGSISPIGTVSVNSGGDQTFTITPNSGYRIADVLVDGVSVGAVGSYQFPAIKADHTIAASFAAIGSSGGGTDTGTDTDSDTDSDTDTGYRLSYETNGGNAISPAWYGHGATVKLNKVPYKSGYLFTGWYADKGLTQKVAEVTMRQNYTVYAGWRQSAIPAILNGENHFAYVAGYADGTVQPLENISRAEVAMIFYRLLTDEARQSYETSENPFVDVTEDLWCNTAISTMTALGVVKGRNAEIFSPNEAITRAEFAAICARFDDSPIGQESEITDISGHWAEDDIVRAVNLGWCKGYGDKTFRPDNSITRAEAMTMINSVLCRIPENTGDLLQGMRAWPDNSDVTAWYYLAVQEATNGHDYIRKPGGIYEKWAELQP